MNPVLHSACLVLQNFPAALTNQLNQETVRTLSAADIKERFLSVGVETMGRTPDAFAAKIKSEMTRMGKVIRDAGIKAN